MVILLDANILLDFMLHRDPTYQSSKHVLEYCMAHPNSGFVAFHTIPTIYYVLRKHVESGKRKNMLRDICTVVTVVGASHEDVVEAIDREDFSDFEDCLQMYCAKDIRADYIVTNNIKDFKNSDIPVITSEDASKILYLDKSIDSERH